MKTFANFVVFMKEFLGGKSAGHTVFANPRNFFTKCISRFAWAVELFILFVVTMISRDQVSVYRMFNWTGER